MLRWTTDSIGAEDLAPACLTSSLEHSTSNAPMPSLTPSVQPVTWAILTWSSLDLHLVLRFAPMPRRRNFRQPSDAPMLHASVLPVLLFSAELLQFSVSLSFFFVYCFVWHFYFIPEI